MLTNKAVSVKTLGETTTLLSILSLKGFTFKKTAEEYFAVHGEDLCILLKDNKKINYHSKSYYVNKGIEVISLDEFLNDINSLEDARTEELVQRIINTEAPAEEPIERVELEVDASEYQEVEEENGNNEPVEVDYPEVIITGGNSSYIGKKDIVIEDNGKTVVLKENGVWDKDKIEYLSKQVDWSKVEVDTPIIVTFKRDGLKHHRHFAKYKNGLVYYFGKGEVKATNNGALLSANKPEDVELA